MQIDEAIEVLNKYRSVENDEALTTVLAQLDTLSEIVGAFDTVDFYIGENLRTIENVGGKFLSDNGTTFATIEAAWAAIKEQK